jgi:hypothetical protein
MSTHSADLFSAEKDEMLVILRGTGLSVLVTSSYILEKFGPLGVRILVVGYVPQRYLDEHWVITPITVKMKLLEDAMFQRHDSSIMFLEDVKRTRKGELLVRPGVHYDRCAMYEKNRLEFWFWKSLRSDQRVQFIHQIEHVIDRKLKDHIVIDIQTHREKAAMPHWNVHWVGVNFDVRLPQVVALFTRKKMHIQRTKEFIDIQGDDSLMSAMDVAGYIKGVVVEHIGSMRWARL